MSLYDSVRASVAKSGEFEQVSVNQRALIDKILARYASAGAVYRELLQNSNDANATDAEIYFTTSPEKNIVTQVQYKNNGMPFRPQDWARLKKIAEGNPDESKIGAFGVGAYTMFSICEEPIILSGNQALAFVWRGDALWTKTIDTDKQRDPKWTTFILPSRDPYPLPSLVDFGEFLCASLTFTKNLSEIRVFVNGKKRMNIVKIKTQESTPVQIQQNSSWWKADGALTASPQGLFSLKDENSLLESFYHIQVNLDGETAAVTARYLSAIAKTKIPSTMVKKMERVTKKKPPSKVEVQIFLGGQENFDKSSGRGKAYKILQSFSPRVGEGRIFIGFRTSQTTGLAAHLAAPFVPTVEREAMDLQDQTLRVFNLELLEFSGILMRLTLEHGMSALGVQYEKGVVERAKLDEKLIKENDAASKTEETKSITTASDEESVVDDDASRASSTSMWGFAKYMAKGVKKTIVKVKSKVGEIVDDGGELMNPRDPRPLCHEETQAIILMQSFCPRQSTPDPLVGTALAQGFSGCFAEKAPPVLTRSGVVPGDQARLPNKGMEAFCKEGVIRSIVYQNAEEYHNVIAQCRVLDLKDLAAHLTENILEEKQLIRLMNWWVRYTKINTHVSSYQGVDMKERIRFVLGKNEGQEAMDVLELRNYLFYLDKEKIRTGSGYNIGDLPMPESILPKTIQDSVTVRTLNDQSLRVWFSPLPVEIWIDFIAGHPSISSGQPEDETLCLRVLSTMSQEYSRRPMSEQRAFGSYCQSVLREKKCIPFDSSVPTTISADYPSNLYLYSAELKAFDGIGNFHKVSQHLKPIGITDDFLVSLGVRKSVAIDFLFAHLDTLQWSRDPKPLIEYLRSATLTKEDIKKLSATQYLPAENDESRMFGPSELYLPNKELRILPFVKLLQWPSEDDITERSLNGKFLTNLGLNVLPPLVLVLLFMARDSTDDSIRLKCLEFVAKRLGSGGDYASDYDRLSRSDKVKLKFLPCVATSPISGEEKKTLFSVLTCCYDGRCAVMGFPVIDPFLKEKAKLYGTLFKCVAEPAPNALIQKLRMLVSQGKKIVIQSEGKDSKEVSEQVVNSFSKIFGYLSSRTSDLSASMVANLAKEDFVPCLVDDRVEWFKTNEVFFQSKDGDENVTQSLFQVVEFSPFLAAAGVKQEAATKDIFRLMIQSPETVLAAAKSEGKYKQFLRRVAAHKPFQRVTPEIRDSRFLLAYTMSKEESKERNESKERTTFELAKAKDIYIIDNSFFARMFPVKRAPHESDLEDFYAIVGSKYISKEVKKKYHVVGETQQDSPLTKELVARIQERGPLLVSPSVTSRPLVSNAASIIDKKKLDIIEVPELKAVFSLNQSTRSQRVTCCSTQGERGKNCLYVTKDFDWFDVGYAIGELILKRCQLEDAFFISSLLEAPLDQLRARGFPVDRIIHPDPPPEPEPTSESAKHYNILKNGTNGAAGPTGNQPAALGAAGTTEKVTPKSKREEGKEGPEGKKEVQGSLEDYVAVLKNMFPGIDEVYLRNQLGDKPTMQDVKALAEDILANGYPKNVKNEIPQPQKEEPRKSKLFGSKKLGRLMGASGFAGSSKLQQGSCGGVQQIVPPSPYGHGNKTKKSPETIANIQNSMEQQLVEKIKQSTQVVGNGLSSKDRLEEIPKGMDHEEKCELVPGQDLKPFVNPATGKDETHNGIKLFSARKHADSESFVRSHMDAAETFAVVLERLSDVYGINLKSVAIYHNHVGNAIAFNANRALYFNLHYFYAMHYGENASPTSNCYSYWFVIFAHELAHHFVSAHNRSHAFYTENFCTIYMPKLLTMLSKV